MTNENWRAGFPPGQGQWPGAEGRAYADPSCYSGYGAGQNPSAYSGYGAGQNPAASGAYGNADSDINAILAEIQREALAKARAAINNRAGFQPLEETPPPFVEPTAAPKEENIVESPPDEQKLQWEMMEAMRDLTEELRQFRRQIETRPYHPDAYLGEHPLASSRDVVDVGARPSQTQEGCFSEFVVDADSSPEGTTEADAQGEQSSPVAQEEEKKSNKVLSIISNVLFYVVIVSVVLGAFLLRSTNEGRPLMLAGFSAANVLTGSMEDTYPRGSLIVTRSVDADELKVGDDITYMVSETSSITHRIIGITENYQGTGKRAFETKGTMNPNPDKEKVAAANVVGKVIFCSKALGKFASFVKTNWPFLLFLLVLIVGLVSFLKWNAKRADTDEDEAEKAKKEAETKEGKAEKAKAISKNKKNLRKGA